MYICCWRTDMNITECFPMKKRRYSNDKTPKRSPRAGKSWHTPRHFTTAADQGLDIIWDNNSPSPRTYALRKRKKHNGSDSSSSGGEISDLVQKLADKSGATPDLNPPLLNFWMEKGAADALNGQPSRHNDTTEKKKKKKIFQTPSRRPRRNLRRNNKAKTKLLSQELQSLVHKIQEEETLLLQQTIKSKRCQEQKLLLDPCDSRNNEGKNMEPVTVSCPNELDLINSDELVDIWEDDEDDVLLSQLDISQLCNGEISAYTDTKAPDRDTKPSLDVVVLRKTPKTSPEKVFEQTSPDDKFVSQLWELDDDGSEYDDDGLLQSALEDFEKSQSTSTCMATTSTAQDSLTRGLITNQPPSPPLVRRDVLKPQNVSKAGADVTCSKLSKSHEAHPSIKGTRNSSRLLGNNWVKTDMTTAEICFKQPLQSAKKQSNISQPKKYSKEAIEQKKREAQQKRKQKLSRQSAQCKQTQNVTTNSQLNRPKPAVPLSLARRR